MTARVRGVIAARANARIDEQRRVVDVDVDAASRRRADGGRRVAAGVARPSRPRRPAPMPSARKRQLQRVGAVGDRDARGGAAIGRELALEGLDLGTEDVLAAIQHARNRGVELRAQRRVMARKVVDARSSRARPRVIRVADPARGQRARATRRPNCRGPASRARATGHERMRARAPAEPAIGQRRAAAEPSASAGSRRTLERLALQAANDIAREEIRPTARASRRSARRASATTAVACTGGSIRPPCALRPNGIAPT